MSTIEKFFECTLISMCLPLFMMTDPAYAQSASDYYPLNVGDYAIQHTDYVDGVLQPTTFRMDVEAIDQIGGESYYRWKQHRRVDDGSQESIWYSWIRSDVSGCVLGAFGYEPAIVEIDLPTATITMDGNPADWTGIDPLVSDPQGDDSPDYTGDDVKALYAAQDAEFLYLRMDLWENVNTRFRNESPPDDGRYFFYVGSDANFSAMFMSINYEEAQFAWRLRNNESMPQGLEGFEYVGVAGSVIELKIPFAMIGTPTTYSEILGSTINTPNNEFNTLDEVRKRGTSIFDPPYPWVPNEIQNVGYTWEFDAPEMGGYYSYLVESTSETVQVPAGVFDNCIRVRMVITDTFEDTTQINTMYFAPGVGQVLNESWNIYYGEQHFALTEYSIQAPNITLQTTLGTAVAGDAFTITVTPSQQMIPITQKLYYRAGGQATFQEVDLTESGNGYAGIIPAGDVTIRGIEYYVRISDGQNDVTFPELNASANPVWVGVQVNNYRPPLGLRKMKYKMISVPVNLTNPAIEAVLLDDYGEYDEQQWRLCRYHVHDTTYYDEYPNIDTTFTPGTAFWLIHRSGTGFDIENGWSMDVSDPYIITLDTGWNQIGNPFGFSVDWSSVNIQGNVEAPVHYDGDDYTYNITVIDPWDGYFVMNRGTVPATIVIPPAESQNLSSKEGPPLSIQSENEYMLQLSTDIPGFDLIDTQNYVGFLKCASIETDDLDISEAPSIGDYVQFSIVDGPNRLAGSFMPTNPDGGQWDCELRSSLPAEREVRFRLTENGHLPDNMKLYILDEDFKCPISIENNQFKVWLRKKYPVRHLNIIIGSIQFAEDAGNGISLTPLNFSLSQNYPNPFNPQTTIEYQIGIRERAVLVLYNMLGHQIRTLIDTIQNPGRYSVIWDGMDDAGRPVAAGVYFFKLTVAGFMDSKKLVLLR